MDSLVVFFRVLERPRLFVSIRVDRSPFRYLFAPAGQIAQEPIADDSLYLDRIRAYDSLRRYDSKANEVADMKRAFTLIELLLVLSILAIMASIGIVKMGTLRSLQEKNEYRMVARDLKYARNLAMTTRRKIYFSFHPELKGYSIGESRGDYTKKTELKYLRLVPIETSDEYIEFSPGGAPNRARTLELQAEDRVYQITVQLATGKVNMKGVVR